MAISASWQNCVFVVNGAVRAAVIRLLWLPTLLFFRVSVIAQFESFRFCASDTEETAKFAKFSIHSLKIIKHFDPRRYEMCKRNIRWFIQCTKYEPLEYSIFRTRPAIFVSYEIPNGNYPELLMEFASKIVAAACESRVARSGSGYRTIKSTQRTREISIQVGERFMDRVLHALDANGFGLDGLVQVVSAE